MGLFSSTKKVYVSSTAYNMAGEFALRPNYLKTSLFKERYTNASSLGGYLVDEQFKGPGMDQKLFFRWAKNDYPEGEVSGQISNYQNLSSAQTVVAASAISISPAEELQIAMSFLDDAEIHYWAERHILDNYPSLFDTNWVSDYEDSSGKLKIVYADASEELVAVPDYNRQSTYLYVYYNTLTGTVTSPYVLDSTTSNEPSRPDDTGFTQDSITNTTVTETLQDGDPVTTRQETVTDYEEVMSKTVYLGQQGTALVTEEHRLTIWKRHRIIETAPDYEEIEMYYDSQLEISTITSDDTSNRNLFIYEIDTGNVALDGLKVDGTTFQEFFPIIPLRHYNKPISHADFVSDYTQFKKAYRKSIGSKIEDILESIEDNANIDDVDHCFLVFGAEINTEHREGLRYIYEFFKSLLTEQTATETDVLNWANSQSYADYQSELADWLTAQDDPSDPDFGSARPQHVTYDVPNFSKLDIKSVSSSISIPYDTSIEWLSIAETVSTGVGKVGAKVNELWWEVQPDITDPSEGEGEIAQFFGSARTSSVNHVRLYWQKTANTYVYLDVYGMSHINRVYNGKAVIITAKEGIEDSDESGFIIPMHYPTIKKIPLVWLNELGIQNRVLVFNSYQVVKQRWWQRGVFKLLFAVVIAVIAALVMPTSVGLLGSHLSVGSSLGFTGTSALIAGAVVNAIAAIAVSAALTEAATSAFGEEWGGVIAAIAGLVIGNVVGSFHTQGEFAIHWGTMSKADVLLGMTDALSKGVQGYVKSELSDISEQLEKITEDYENQIEDISELFAQLGYSGIVVDPLLWMEQQNSNKSFESSDTFIKRTLLTGSDIAELTLTMVSDFAELSLTLPEPIA